MTISGKHMNLYDLYKKLAVARQNGFVSNKTIELITKIYSHQRYVNRS